jgi:AcrR family transcriptional regulator
MKRTDTLFFRSLEPEEGWAGQKDAVPASQRARILDAITHVTADKGYLNVTVADVVSAAGVSRSTFYDMFKDREDCFLEACERGARLLIADIVHAAIEAGPDSDWRDLLRAVTETSLRGLADNPEFARALLVDTGGAGPRAVELRRRVYDQLADQYGILARLAASQEPGFGEIPRTYLLGLVGGIAELVQQHLLVSDPEALPELLPVIMQFVIAVMHGVALPPPVVTKRP